VPDVNAGYLTSTVEGAWLSPENKNPAVEATRDAFESLVIPATAAANPADPLFLRSVAARYLTAATHQRLPWTRTRPILRDQSGPVPDLDPTSSARSRSLLTPATHARPAWSRPVTTQPVPAVAAVVDVQAPLPAQTWHRNPTVPQQRSRTSPAGLLDAALLEGVLLGGADAARHATLAATHVPRTWTPQQPRRAATTPGLLDSALLEIPPQSATARLVPAANARSTWTRPAVPGSVPAEAAAADLAPAAAQPPRRAPDWTPWQAQPRRLADASSPRPDLEPTLTGHLPRTLAATVAAWSVDRREVPQQRPYISDPSTYPSGAATDPLTIAWGAGGTYWHLYNAAAVRTEKRTPLQRAYLSEPGLLATALLEPPLLGARDQLRRHAESLAGWRTRDVPRRTVFDLPPVAADPLFLTEQTRRRHSPATHASRWVLRTQRPALVDVGTVALVAPGGHATASDRIAGTVLAGDRSAGRAGAVDRIGAHATGGDRDGARATTGDRTGPRATGGER